MSALQTGNSSNHAAAIAELYRERPRSNVLRFSAVALAAFVIYAFVSPDIEWGDFFTERRRSNFLRFLERDAMPFPLRDSGFTWNGFADWAGELIRTRGFEAMSATLWISVLAITLAALVGYSLAPLGAANLSSTQPFGVASGHHRIWFWRGLVAGTRFISVLLRAIPEFVWAFLLLAMLGPTAWPAVIALAIHNSGILSRLGSETIENLEAAPLKSLAAIGASRRQLTIFAVLPLALPRLLLYFFYRFETCVREATVLGMLGVVSLGYWIADARGRQNYDEMILLVALGAVLVLLGDAVSFVARRWIR